MKAVTILFLQTSCLAGNSSSSSCVSSLIDCGLNGFRSQLLQLLLTRYPPSVSSCCLAKRPAAERYCNSYRQHLLALVRPYWTLGVSIGSYNCNRSYLLARIHTKIDSALHRDFRRRWWPSPESLAAFTLALSVNLFLSVSLSLPCLCLCRCLLCLSLPLLVSVCLSLSVTLILTHSPTHSLTHTFTHPLTHPCTHSLTHSLTHPSLTHIVNHWLFIRYLWIF